MPRSKETKASPPEIAIRPFEPGDAAAFRRLNEEWITRYFRMEAKDEATFSDPEESILRPGGRILFATLGAESVGCCALLWVNDTEFEVGKMAVSPGHQGHGIGRTLLQAAIAEATRAGARRLYLETNHVLTPAIRLYESVGFRHVEPAQIPPSRYARADVYMELLLK